jgi:hypothetical protein
MTRSTANNKGQSFVYHGVGFFGSGAVPHAAPKWCLLSAHAKSFVAQVYLPMEPVCARM